MLIHLDQSITQLHPPLAQELIDSLEDIAGIIRSGNHLITGDLKTLKFLSTHEALGSSARRAYNGLATKYSQFASAKSMVTTFAEIGVSGDQPTLINRENKNIILIPLRKVRHLSLRNPTEVIYEEIQDDFIYEIISRWYVRRHISPGFLNRNYRPIHGGGGRTHAVYSEAQRLNNQFCLCVTDSDKKFPTDTPGPTSSEVRAVNSNDLALSFHLDLDFHEIENLVPLQFLRSNCTSPTSKAIIDKIQQAEITGHPEAKLFWDYKKGFSVASLRQSNNGWLYWKSALGLPETTCTEQCSSQRCQCEVLKPWPEKRLVKDKIQSYSEMDPSECNVLSKLWLTIGGTLTSWSASAIPKTT